VRRDGTDASRGSFPAMATLSKLAGQDGEQMTQKEPDRPVASKSRNREWFGSRAALFAGFGTLLILMATVSIDSLYTLQAFEIHNTQIRQEFVYREHTLEQVRTGVYESGDTNFTTTIFALFKMPHSHKVGYMYALTHMVPYPEVGFSTITSVLPVTRAQSLRLADKQ
jgi:hypothetical protein